MTMVFKCTSTTNIYEGFTSTFKTNFKSSDDCARLK